MMRIYRTLCNFLAAAAVTFAAASACAADWRDDCAVIIPDDVSTDDGTRAATRMEFCKILYKLLEVKDVAPQKCAAEFSDTDDEIIGALCAGGFIDGMGDNMFCSDDTVTREQAAKLLCAAMDGLGMDDRDVVDGTFGDIDTADEWAREYIERVGRNEIMEGSGNGYYTWKDSEAVIHRPDVFRLEDSPFEPQADYTVQQSAVTIYRLYERMPNTEDEKQSWDIGDGIRLYADGTTLWSEKDGEARLIEPQDHVLETEIKIVNGHMTAAGYKEPETVTLPDGDIVMAINDGVYSLCTGKRLLRLESSVDSLTPLYASCTVSFIPGGTSPEYVVCSYDFGGNRFAISNIDTFTDSDGATRYIYVSRADGGSKDYVFSKPDSIEPLVTSEWEIKTESASNGIFYSQSETKAGVTHYNVYDTAGETLYEDAAYVNLISDDMFAVRAQTTDGTLELYRGADKTAELKGDTIYNGVDGVYTPKNFIVTKTGEDEYNLYAKDGTLYLEGVDLYMDKTDDDDIRIRCYDGSSVSYYSDNAAELTAKIPAPHCKLYGEYFHGYSTDYSTNAIYDASGKALLDFSGMDCYCGKEYLYVYSTDDAEEEKLDIYDSGTLELIKSFNGESAKQIYGSGFVNFSDDPLRGDWYNVKTDKRAQIECAAKPNIYVSGDTIVLDVISEGVHDVLVYNNDLERINRFSDVSFVTPDYDLSEYFKFGYEDKEVLYLPAKNEVVLEGAYIGSRDVKAQGLRVFSVYDKEAKQRSFYSLENDTLEHMLTLAAEDNYYYCGDDYILIGENNVRRVYYDYSGNLYNQ